MEKIMLYDPGGGRYVIGKLVQCLCRIRTTTWKAIAGFAVFFVVLSLINAFPNVKAAVEASDSIGLALAVTLLVFPLKR